MIGNIKEKKKYLTKRKIKEIEQSAKEIEQELSTCSICGGKIEKAVIESETDTKDICNNCWEKL